LERAIEEHGECPPDGSHGFPDGVVTISRDQWRAQFYNDAKAKEPKVEDNTLKQRFTRATSELVEKQGMVNAVGERVWLSGTSGTCTGTS
jgi:hypothetical protein